MLTGLDPFADSNLLPGKRKLQQIKALPLPINRTPNRYLAYEVLPIHRAVDAIQPRPHPDYRI
jgi:hypothetical protein